MPTNRNPLLCDRCEIKAKRTGSNICDRCIFEMKTAEVKRRQAERNRYSRPRGDIVRMDEIVVNASIKSVPPPPKKAMPFEVSFLSKSGIRMVERYANVQMASTRFNYLKDDLNVAGLRFWGITSKKRIELGRHDGYNRL